MTTSGGWRSCRTSQVATSWAGILSARSTRRQRGLKSGNRNSKPPPKLAAILLPWINEEQLLDSSTDRPTLRDIIEVETRDGDELVTKILLLEDHSEILAQWETYVETQWLPWATLDRMHQRIQKQYAKLFSIYQRQKTLGEDYEIVLSLGYLTWCAKNCEVKTHVVTAQAALTFDDVRGIVRVGAASDGARLTLEQDMLEVDDRPQVDDIEAELRDSEFIMWDGQTIPDILRGWVNRLSAEGEYTDSLSCSTAPQSKPVVSWAPALVMRRRNDRTILRRIKDLISKFEAGSPPSLGIEHLVAVIENRAPANGDEGANEPTTPTQPSELFLPLATNDEQRLIVEKIDRSQGVLVQGPPGTGKSHTIANLLCHLLAIGRRVLVTSHTARALEVLRDKLPPEIATLCVQLLGNDLTALQGLENSVREITERYHDRNEERSGKRIAELDKALDEARRTSARCQQMVRSIREADTFDHEAMYGGYRGTAQAIAQQIHAREPSFKWIVGLVDADSAVPLSNDEAIRLLDLEAMVDDTMLAAVSKTRPRIDEMPEPRTFSTTVQTLSETKARCDALRIPDDAALVSRLTDLSDDAFAEAHSRVTAAAHAALALDSAERWLHDCRADLMARKAHTWAALLSATALHLSRIGDRVQWATEREMRVLDDIDEVALLADAKALLAHFQSGKSLGFGPFRPAVVKRAQYILRNVMISGTPCTTQHAVEELCILLEVKRELQNLSRLWAHVASPPALTIALQVAYFYGLREQLAAAMELQGLVEQMDATWRSFGNPQPLWSNISESRRVVEIFEFAAAVRAWNRAKKPLDFLARSLRQLAADGDAHEVTQMLANAVQGLDPDDYKTAYDYFIAHHCGVGGSPEGYEITRVSAAAPKLLQYIISPTADRLEPPAAPRQSVRSVALGPPRQMHGCSVSRHPAEKVRLVRILEIERCKADERKCLTSLASEKA